MPAFPLCTQHRGYSTAKAPREANSGDLRCGTFLLLQLLLLTGSWGKHYSSLNLPPSCTHSSWRRYSQQATANYTWEFITNQRLSLASELMLTGPCHGRDPRASSEATKVPVQVVVCEGGLLASAWESLFTPLAQVFPTSGSLFLFRRPVVLARCPNLARQLSSYSSPIQCLQKCQQNKAHPWEQRFHLTLTNPTSGNSVPVPVHHRAKRNSHAFVFCAGEKAKTEVQKITQLLTPDAGLGCQSWTDCLCLALTAPHTVLFTIAIATAMKNRMYWRTHHCQWLSAMIINSQLTPLIALAAISPPLRPSQILTPLHYSSED